MGIFGDNFYQICIKTNVVTSHLNYLNKADQKGLRDKFPSFKRKKNRRSALVLGHLKPLILLLFQLEI